MSNYGHFTQEYYGNKIKFHNNSFLISGISFYQDNIKNIGYNSDIIMEYEPLNKYDKNAIKIIYNNNIIGYVPKKEQDKIENINDKLKIINIKRDYNSKNYGIRVIPEKYFKEEMIDNSLFN